MDQRHESSFFYQEKTAHQCQCTYSEFKRVTRGIPLGSVLGPILFVIHINDLPDKLSSDCYVFVDDTKVFCQIGTTQDKEKLQSDLKNKTTGKTYDYFSSIRTSVKCYQLEITEHTHKIHLMQH